MAERTTETEVGFLSKLVTRLYTRKAEAILHNLEVEGMDADMAIDHRVLQAMGKWVLDNGVFASPDSSDETSPLHARLQAIKEKSTSKVIDFRSEAAERGIG